MLTDRESPPASREHETDRSSRKLLPDPSCDKYGLVDHPIRTGPFAFDLLSTLLLYLEDDDLASLMAVSQVCNYWRFVSNMLPQWSTALHPKTHHYDHCTIGPPRVRDECMEELKKCVERHHRQAEERDFHDLILIRDEFARRHVTSGGESLAYGLLTLVCVAAMVLWIVALLSNGEWRGYGREPSIRRFPGYPCVCSSHFSKAAGSSCWYSGWEQELKCCALKTVIDDSPSMAFFGVSIDTPSSSFEEAEKESMEQLRWLCQGDKNQLREFQHATNLQLVGLCFGLLFAVLLLVMTSTIMCGPTAWWSAASKVTLVATVGLCVVSVLTLASLPIIKSLYETPCAPTAPTAVSLGWDRDHRIVIALHSLTGFAILLGALLRVRRERWVAAHQRRVRSWRHHAKVAM